MCPERSSNRAEDGLATCRHKCTATDSQRWLQGEAGTIAEPGRMVLEADGLATATRVAMQRTHSF